MVKFIGELFITLMKAVFDAQTIRQTFARNVNCEFLLPFWVKILWC